MYPWKVLGSLYLHRPPPDFALFLPSTPPPPVPTNLWIWKSKSNKYSRQLSVEARKLAVQKWQHTNSSNYTLQPGTPYIHALKQISDRSPAVCRIPSELPERACFQSQTSRTFQYTTSAYHINLGTCWRDCRRRICARGANIEHSGISKQVWGRALRPFNIGISLSISLQQLKQPISGISPLD